MWQWNCVDYHVNRSSGHIQKSRVALYTESTAHACRVVSKLDDIVLRLTASEHVEQ